jgi:hypothetical protein
MKKITCIAGLILSLLASNFAYGQEIPVLLMVKRSDQVDTLGCNFVEQMTSLVYDEVKAGRVKLWDSQKKSIQIFGSTVTEIEKHSGVKFTELESIFVYEMWENNKKEITSRTLGMSFIHRGNSSEEVAFGYIDFKDIQETVMRTRINTNANGVYSATYANYLYSKNFIYNLVQFGGKAVKSATESEEIKRNFIRNLKFNETLLGYYPPDKYISYILDQITEGADKKTVNSRNLIKQLEEYFLKNQEVFFNLGGDRIMSHLQKNKFKITRITVTEIWRKTGDNIQYDPRSLVIYINDSALNEITQKNIKDLNFKFNNTDLFTFFQSKEFNLIIYQINSQEIKRKDAFLYYKALLTMQWNRLIEYVVNY